MTLRYIILIVPLILHVLAAYAEKPDSAFGPEVWSREKELLRSIEDRGTSKDQDAETLTYIRLARIFKDNARELTYLDMAEKSAFACGNDGAVAEIMMLRLEHLATYSDMERFCRYADVVRGYMAERKDRRGANVEYLVIKRHVDEGLTQTALQTARKMLSDATVKNDTYRQAYAYYSIGLIYQSVAQYGESVDALERCVRMMEGTMKDFPRLDCIKAQLELLSSQYALGRNQESLETCMAASRNLDEFIADTDSDFQMGVNCMSMRLYIECYAARNYMALHDMAKACGHLHTAAGLIYPSIGLDRETYNETYAMYCSRTGNYETALKYADMSVAAFRTAGLAPYYTEALELKKAILADMGSWKEAYQSQELVENVRDSLKASRFASELNELRTIYELDKMEAQKKRQQVVILFSVLCCILLMLTVLAYVVYSRRLRLKNMSLYEQINSNMRNVSSSAKVLQMTPDDELSRGLRLFRSIAMLMEEQKPYTSQAFNRSSLAHLMGTNEKYVADAVREGAGTTVANYITDTRLNHSLELLSDEPGDGQLSLDDVARLSGFGSYSSFWRAFQKKYSMTPSEYRNLRTKNRQ